ncbi:hypothetical protein PUN28_014684 [Cardiocondyla obscurior]|uniref:Ribosomal protein L14 n=1 Tax=Cardiocondyla obscurior TaxID=286306 RepID=A0AAW2EUV2_9HYME
MQNKNEKSGTLRGCIICVTEQQCDLGRVLSRDCERILIITTQNAIARKTMISCANGPTRQVSCNNTFLCNRTPSYRSSIVINLIGSRADIKIPQLV